MYAKYTSIFFEEVDFIHCKRLNCVHQFFFKYEKETHHQPSLPVTSPPRVTMIFIFKSMITFACFLCFTEIEVSLILASEFLGFYFLRIGDF